ncbi:unnamed protein product [Rotaria magnacalcarata]|uniref:Uncharacterized protein n=1 Tax=Rotaria magnacalcarata TaxID=392030 RepID=A0A816M8L3_9BILA|nr:unnamed protein product [Rotaria magnacalcarata]CAF1473488.1 unnamed protein product [Rotaria magnacalcarata]CAF1965419.1 unnamed protein product [Rotaria magnacalcarata]CAF2018870.1 unnamed protein product [Rotaria magnacalcarata]CAF2053103.1 unnamed protein product [Rotaria magnacalcarata]
MFLAKTHPPKQNIGKQRTNLLSKSSTRTSSKQESTTKKHNLPKRDRTASLLALQALAKKIAAYKEKYGDIETRHSSIVKPARIQKEN